MAEDSEDDAELIAHQIKRAGYKLFYRRVDNASGVHTALQKEYWDAIIADYSMPSFNGLDVLQILKRSGLDLPFILVSGTVGEDIAVEAMKIGAHDYLMKNNLKRLVPAVEREIREAALRASKRKIEEERLVLIDRLQQALHSRDEFLLIASHELKTPLTSLRLQAQILKRIDSLPLLQQVKEQRRHETMILMDTQIERLAKLIDNLLDVSRISIGKFTIKPSECDLRDLVQEVIHNLREDFKQARCSVTFHADAPVVGNWDYFRMEQVAVNLIGNAIKYAMGTPITISVETQNEHARLIVQDQGPGISKKDQDRIFQRFERAASSDYIGGLGLGLYITRQIVEAHGGFIRIESEKGKGAKFTVDLPLNRGAMEKEAS